MLATTQNLKRHEIIRDICGSTVNRPCYYSILCTCDIKQEKICCKFCALIRYIWFRGHFWRLLCIRQSQTLYMTNKHLTLVTLPAPKYRWSKCTRWVNVGFPWIPQELQFPSAISGNIRGMPHVMSVLFSSVSNIGYTSIELKCRKVSTSIPNHDKQLLIHAITSTVGDLTAD